VNEELFTDEDAPITLAKGMPPVAMKAGFRDFRLHHARIRPGRDGEDGSMADWEALYRTAGEARLKAMYAALPGAIFYNQALVYLEEQQGRQMAKVEAPKIDYAPRVLALLQTKAPTPVQARAIAHLREMAKEWKLYSLDLAMAVNGVRKVLDSPTDQTLAASFGRDPQIVQRLLAKGLI
jgi:hypothetical protein